MFFSNIKYAINDRLITHNIWSTSRKVLRNSFIAQNLLSPWPLQSMFLHIKFQHYLFT